MSDSPATALEALEDRLAYRFRDRTLLEQAVTHLSFIQDNPGVQSNQRLEFLGDAVLQILLADELFHRFPDEREGFLSRHRALLVNGVVLAQLAREIGIETCLRLGTSEETTGGRDRASSLGDAFEALIGALYLDSDLVQTRPIVLRIYGDLEQRLSPLTESENPKGRLQELVQPLHGNNALRYEVVSIEGQDHARDYEVAVYLRDRPLGSGRGTSKKIAEEEAARAALATLAAEKEV